MTYCTCLSRHALLSVGAGKDGLRNAFRLKDGAPEVGADAVKPYTLYEIPITNSFRQPSWFTELADLINMHRTRIGYVSMCRMNGPWVLQKGVNPSGMCVWCELLEYSPLVGMNSFYRRGVYMYVL